MRPKGDAVRVAGVELGARHAGFHEPGPEHFCIRSTDPVLHERVDCQHFDGMKPNTEAVWAERIEEWGRSGQSAAEFAEGKPFTSGTLTWAASLLRKRGKGKRRKGGAIVKRQRKIRIAKVIRRPSQPPVAQSVIVEIGGATISVRRGFDRSLLQEVVVALRAIR